MVSFIFYLSIILYATSIETVISSTDGSTNTMIRGVPKAGQMYLMLQDEFKCRSTTQIIPISRINDDYCDCSDGSDEPGTSACRQSTFYCPNEGYKGQYVFSSVVNDGICDCCDGSDEWAKPGTCPNTCAVLGAELKKHREEEELNTKLGMEEKNKYIEQAAKSIAEKRDELTANRDEVTSLQASVSSLEEQKKEVEQREQTRRDELSAIKAEADKKAAEEAALLGQNKQQTEEENLQKLLEQEVDGIFPAEDVAAAEPGPSTEHDDDDDEHSSFESVEDSGEAEEEEQEDAQNAEENNALSGQQESTPTPPEPTDALLDSILAEKNKYNEALAQARRELSDMENHIRKTEELLATDFGKNNEFFPLHGQCFDLTAREYTYTVCPFDNAKQAHTSLGKFEKWEPAYTTMVFSNGQQCWGGPKRSIKVNFICGAKNEMISVEEPSKCEYTAKMKTPCVCHDDHSTLLHHENESHLRENYF
eukprot:TRINITY_DN1608_c0_g1_i1.p1 TRINITY_DN1608_c0_g1~~TRINITY_DN1608_c0_g1_i1.p1  ORF type:complete len:479 (-),score=155.53 TRINITY_DN1608_c0_g1_i1:23-1459(-)